MKREQLLLIFGVIGIAGAYLYFTRDKEPVYKCSGLDFFFETNGIPPDEPEGVWYPIGTEDNTKCWSFGTAPHLCNFSLNLRDGGTWLGKFNYYPDEKKLELFYEESGGQIEQYELSSSEHGVIEMKNLETEEVETYVSKDFTECYV